MTRAGGRLYRTGKLPTLNRHRSLCITIIFLHLPVMQMQYALTAMSDARIVGNHDDGFARGHQFIE